MYFKTPCDQAIAILSVAAVLVLLLGEIDLSLAAVAYACSAIMAIVSVCQGWNVGSAILAALVAGALIGLINGFFVAGLRVPSFIVTLAGSIGYAGLLLVVMGAQTTLVVRDPFIRALAPTYLPAGWGWGLPLCVWVYMLWGFGITKNGDRKLTFPSNIQPNWFYNC